MATYLAFMAVGQFDIRSYEQDGIKYWDAIDSPLMADRLRRSRRDRRHPVPVLAGRATCHTSG